MIALAFLAMAAVYACPVEHASYVLRRNPQVTAHFERAPANEDWQNGVLLALHGAASGRTTYWLPWYGGTDDGRHVRHTELLDRNKDIEAQRRIERRGDLDFFTLDRAYTFISTLPTRGSRAPAHLLIPDLDLWHGGEWNRKKDSSPRAFFDLTGCRRSTSKDRGMHAILPHIA